MLNLLGFSLLSFACIQFLFQWGILLKNLFVVPSKAIYNFLKFSYSFLFKEYPVVGFLLLLVDGLILSFVDPFFINRFGVWESNGSFVIPIVLINLPCLFFVFGKYFEME